MSSCLPAHCQESLEETGIQCTFLLKDSTHFIKYKYKTELKLVVYQQKSVAYQFKLHFNLNFCFKIH